MNLYILDDHCNAILEPDVVKWGKWMESNVRVVQANREGDFVISTVFLGLDHNFGSAPCPTRKPLLFETMVFDAEKNDIECERCSTWDEAKAQHQSILSRYRIATEYQTTPWKAEA